MASTATEIGRPLTPLKSSRAESAIWLPLAFAAVYILWGSTYIGIRIAIESFPPLAMAAIRHSLVGLILYPILRIKTGIWPTAAHWWTAAVTGVSLLCITNGGLSWAEQRVPSGIAALLSINAVAVAGNFGLASAARDATWAAGNYRAGIGIRWADAAGWSSYARRGAANRPGGVGRAVDGSFHMGRRLVVFEAANYAGIAVAGGGDAEFGGGRGLWIAAIVSGELRALHFGAISGRSWIALIYLIVFGSGIGFTAYLYILKESTPSKVATYAFVNPVVALFLGWLLAGETIRARTAIAAAVILTAVVLVISAPRARAAKAKDH